MKQNNIGNMLKYGENRNDIIQLKPSQKKCPSLNKDFQSHFNPDHTKLKLPAEIEHKPIYIQSL